MTGYYLDFSRFGADIQKLLGEDFPNWLGEGLFEAMNELLSDSKTKPPQAPRDMGDLHAATAGTVKVKKTRKEITATGGFNIKYAHRHHEVEPGTYKYTKDKGVKQPGPKFMESKMAQYKDKYIGIVADSVRNKGK